MILPATTVRKGIAHTDHKKYGFCDYEDDCIQYGNKCSFRLHYLNCIHDNAQLGKDGYVQSGVDGPDVLFNSYSFPTKNLFDKTKNYVSLTKICFLSKN